MRTSRNDRVKLGEIEVTLEMIAEGHRALAVNCEAFAYVAAMTGEELRAVYIAMRRLEPVSRSRTHRAAVEDLSYRETRTSAAG